MTDEAEDPVPRMDEAPEPAADPRAKSSTLDLLWANVEARWDDDKAHAAFLEFAAAKGELPEAAGRYREIKDAGGPRSELAQKKLSAIMLIAMQMLASERTDPAKKPPKWLTFVVFAVSFAIVAWVARLVFRR